MRTKTNIVTRSWRNLAIGSKLASLTTILVMGLIFGLTYLTIQRERVNFQNELEDQVDLLLKTLPLTIRDQLYRLELDELMDVARVISSNEDVVLFLIFDKDGATMVDASLPDPVFSQVIDPLGETLIKTDRDQIRMDWQEGRLVAGRAIYLGNQPIGAAAIGLSTEALDSKINTLTQQSILLALVALAFGSGGAFVLSRQITSPLGELAGVASQMAGGDLTTRVVPNSTDEVGQLGDSFNQMADAVQKRETDLRDLAAGLERTVAARTAELEERNQALETINHELAIARTQAEQERSKLAGILEGTSEAIIVTDEDLNVLLFNPAAQSLFDPSMPAIQGRPPEQGMPTTDLSLLLKKALNEGRSVTGEVVSGDGATYYAGVSPVPGIGWVTVMQDISYFKELDQLKSEFLAIASHDLKNPISVIAGYAEMAAESENLDQFQQKALRRILEAARNMTYLVNGLLDIVQIEGGFLGQQELCDIADIVQNEIRHLQDQAAAKHISFETNLEPSLPAVMGSRIRITQVVTNLIGNAIKYTPDHGQVSVAVQSQSNQLNGDEGVLVSVVDNGIGIAPDEVEHVFQRFYRAGNVKKADIEGTGLGLAICKAIVEKHGGRIWVESQLGEGSSFHFVLPAAGNGSMN